MIDGHVIRCQGLLMEYRPPATNVGRASQKRYHLQLIRRCSLVSPNRRRHTVLIPGPGPEYSVLWTGSSIGLPPFNFTTPAQLTVLLIVHKPESHFIAAHSSQLILQAFAPDSIESCGPLACRNRVEHQGRCRCHRSNSDSGRTPPPRSEHHLLSIPRT